MDRTKVLVKINEIIKIFLIIFVIGSPFSISLAQIGLVPAIVFWIISLVIGRFRNFKKTIIDIPIIIYLLGELITSIFCEHSKNAFAGYQSEWQILTVYLIASVSDKKFYKKLVNILFIVSALVAIYGLYQHFTGWDIWRQRQLGTHVGNFYGIVGGFGLHLTFGGYFMMISLLGLSYFINIKKKKYFYLPAVIIIILSTIGSYAKTAWLGFVMGLLMLIFLFNIKNFRKVIVYYLLIIIALSLMLFFIKPIKERVFVQQYSFEHRKVIWNSAIQIIKHHPIIGVGNGNFKRYSEMYMKNSGFPVEGHPHNDYLNIYLTSGIIGFIGYMLMWFILLKKGIQYVLKEGEDKNLMIGLLSGIVAFMVAGLGQNYFTDSENSMLLWLFIGGINLIISHDNNIKLKQEV